MLASCSIFAALLIATSPPPAPTPPPTPDAPALPAAPDLDPHGATAPNNDDPFGAAALVPIDVRVFVHIRNASGLHAELADRPIAKWLDSLLASGQVERAWTAMARQVDVAAGELFDRCLGRGFTVVLRSRDGGRAEMAGVAGGAGVEQARPGEWAVLTQLDPERARNLLRPFNPRILRPRHGFALEELPEQELLVARAGGMVVVGPIRSPALLNDVIRMIDTGGGTRLSSDPAIARARSLGRGGIGAFLRHDKPMGGWSAAVADVAGDHVSIRHMARFDSAPFSSPPTAHDWDLAPIESVKAKAILAIIAPSDAGESGIESFLHIMLRRPLLPAELQRFPGQRQMIVLSEQEGRLLEKPIDMLVPAITQCVEVGDSRIDRRILDSSMIDLAASIDRLRECEDRLQLPVLEQLDPARPGHINLAPAIQSLTNVPQLADGISLNWTDVKCRGDRWWLICSDPGQLQDVASCLAKGEAGKQETGHWANCGFVNGRRMAVHMRSWIERADVLAAEGQVEDFQRSLKLIADLADGIQTCQWRLSRPCAQTMELHAELTLSPPEPSRPAPK